MVKKSNGDRGNGKGLTNLNFQKPMILLVGVKENHR